jgi:hypothetical protein
MLLVVIPGQEHLDQFGEVGKLADPPVLEVDLR